MHFLQFLCREVALIWRSDYMSSSVVFPSP